MLCILDMVRIGPKTLVRERQGRYSKRGQKNGEIRCHRVEVDVLDDLDYHLTVMMSEVLMTMIQNI
jgi:hypothetical protein